MPYFILAVLLTVMQAAPPVPRQAPDKPARTSNSVKQDSSKKQNPPDVRMRLPTTAESNQPEGQKQCSHDTHETVIIREPTPVPIAHKDWWDRAYVIFTGALVIVGAFGIGLAYRSLRAIESQAGIMRGQLEAMRGQIAQMESGRKQTDQIIETMKDTAKRELRAYVCVSTAHIAFVQERAPVVEIRIRNSGKTPAHDLKAWIGLGDGPYPWRIFPPPEEGFQMGTSIIGPGEEPQALIRQFRVLPKNLMPVIGTPSFTLYAFGKITYKDVFGNEWFTDYRVMFGGSEPQPLRLENGIRVAFMRADTDGNRAT